MSQQATELWNTPAAPKTQARIFHADFHPPAAHKRMDVIAVIPAYNEERFIGSVVLTALKYVDTVIVVDDGSKDRTAEIAELAGAIVVRQPVNGGKGEALNSGFKKAQEIFLPKVVVTLDGDWQHNPEEIYTVAEPVLNGDADLVVGSRYLEKTSKVPLQRIIGHEGFNMLLNMTSGVPLTDSQSGFRAFSPRAVRDIKFTASGFSVESEMQFIAKDYELEVMEVPITITYNDPPKRSVISHGLNVLNGILKLIAQTRPFLFFTVPGVIMVMLSMFAGLFIASEYGQLEDVPFHVVVLVQVMLFGGILALFTGIILHSLRGFILQVITLLSMRNGTQGSIDS